MVYSDATSTFLRRFTAALMVIVVVVASLGSSTGRSLGPFRGQQSVAEFVKRNTSAPKPCQRAVLPGTINTCPVAGFSVSSIPLDEAAYATPDSAVSSLSWHTMNSQLLAQCSGSSPYRPPCLIN